MRYVRNYWFSSFCGHICHWPSLILLTVNLVLKIVLANAEFIYCRNITVNLTAYRYYMLVRGSFCSTLGLILQFASLCLHAFKCTVPLCLCHSNCCVWLCQSCVCVSHWTQQSVNICALAATFPCPNSPQQVQMISYGEEVRLG